MRVHAEVNKDELIGALRDATIDNSAFDVREWSRGDASTLRKIAGLIDRELDDVEDELVPTPIVLPTEGEDLPKTPTP